MSDPAPLPPRRHAKPAQPSPLRRALAPIAVLGVVYGDIGTSPLYALSECLGGDTVASVNPDDVFGVVSLITWTLTLVVTLKYLVYVMRADNHGEGGILALVALCSAAHGLAEIGAELQI